MAAKSRFRDLQHPRKRFHRIAPRTQIKRDEIGLAVGQHRHGRNCRAEMAAVIKFGEGGLHGAVATVDDQHLGLHAGDRPRSEEHTSELQSLMRNSYAVFCLKKKINIPTQDTTENALRLK